VICNCAVLSTDNSTRAAVFIGKSKRLLLSSKRANRLKELKVALMEQGIELVRRKRAVVL
jgi:hypothetical protein